MNKCMRNISLFGGFISLFDRHQGGRGWDSGNIRASCAAITGSRLTSGKVNPEKLFRESAVLTCTFLAHSESNF